LLLAKPMTFERLALSGEMQLLPPAPAYVVASPLASALRP
jgi:hypothetical protein